MIEAFSTIRKGREEDTEVQVSDTGRRLTSLEQNEKIQGWGTISCPAFGTDTDFLDIFNNAANWLDYAQKHRLLGKTVRPNQSGNHPHSSQY